MAHVSLNLGALSIREKLALSKRIFAAMSVNPLFPEPDPPLVLLERLIRELEKQGDDAPSLAKNDALLGATLSRLASYVQKTSNGCATMIRAAGMETEKASDSEALPMPTNLAVERNSSGEIALRCDPVIGAKTYVFRCTPDPLNGTSEWMIGSVSTGNLGTITSLKPGQRYWFQVSAVDPSGQSPWSEPIVEMVQ